MINIWHFFTIYYLLPLNLNLKKMKLKYIKVNKLIKNIKIIIKLSENFKKLLKTL